MTDRSLFLQHIDKEVLTALDRAKALLWLTQHEGSLAGLSTRDICKIIEAAGHSGQNSTRLDRALAADRSDVHRVPGSNNWRLKPAAQRRLDDVYASIAIAPKPPKASDSVLPRTLFNGTRGYIEKVVAQINGSYDSALYDCCAVMCRRLLETLIIEVYEAANRAPAIKGGDGNFYMFSDLLRILLADSNFNISRNAQQGLKDFKKLGDLSAHSRRYNAGQNDIDRVRDGIRVAAEELLHVARLI